MEKKQLYEKICDFYNCSFSYNEDGTVEDNSNDIDWSIKHKNIEDALKDWLFTMEESNEDSRDQADCMTWSKEEIEFIKSL